MANMHSMTPQSHCAFMADWFAANPERWTQGSFARDAEGCATDPGSPGAHAFCAMGLLQRFLGDARTYEHCLTLLTRAITPLETGGSVIPRSIAAFNDTAGRTVEDIIQMFRCASYMPEVEPELNIEEIAAKIEAETKLGNMYVKALADSMMQTKQLVEKNYSQTSAYWNKLASLPPVIYTGDNDVNPLKTPILAGEEVMSMAAKLGLEKKSWSKILKEMRESIAA